MVYTVRIRVRVAGTRRQFWTFLRSEGATNTSSHARRYESAAAADVAAMLAAGHFAEAGHTVIGWDVMRVEARP
jgi:hypothetical protein